MRLPVALVLAIAIAAAVWAGTDARRDETPPATPTTETASVETPVGEPAQPGDPAPAFSLPDTNGETHRLSQYAGEWVVLEWLNYDCPFVRKHYGSGNMQALQERWTGEGVTWLSIVSSAPGEQGHFTNAEMNRRTDAADAHQTAVLMDPAGRVGRAYGARTTPHMIVINPAGEIVYNGAIDNRPSPSPSSLDGATNYVSQALSEGMAGRAISTPRTQPYGCSVKYAS